METWKKLAVGVESLADGDRKNVSMALEMNVDTAPTIVAVSIVPVTISDLFKGVQKCQASVGKAIVSVEKANASVGKTNDSVGKVVVLPLKCILPLSDKEMCGPSLMAKQTKLQNTQDPAVTTSGANS